jgi:hypothetical protein
LSIRAAVGARRWAQQYYRTPLVGKQIVSDMVLSRIFSNMEEIFEFTNTQCATIRERVGQWDEAQTIADVFSFSVSCVMVRYARCTNTRALQAEVWSDLYTTYIQNYLAALRCLQQQEQSNKRFSTFLAEQRAKASMALSEGLALPLGQLCRYHVMMCQLLRRTDGEHGDYANIEAAVDSYNIVIGALDDACTPLIRCRERVAHTASHLALVEKEVPMPTMRAAVQKTQRTLQRLAAAYLPGSATAAVRVPTHTEQVACVDACVVLRSARSVQLETLHSANTDIETVLVQVC